MPLTPLPDIEIFDPIASPGVKYGTRNQPVIMLCQSQSGVSEDGYISHFVVKLKNDLPYKEHSCAREMIGSLLATAFGLLTPPPGIINIPDDFYEIVDNQALRDRLQASSGYNFGSRNVEINAFLGVDLPPGKLQEGFEVFVFDALIQNSDRRVGNPNLFSSPDGFILFDHELAFPFTKTVGIIGGFPNPWELTDPRYLYFLKDHIFYQSVRSNKVNFDSFHEKLTNLTEPFIDGIISKLPDEWYGKEIEIIKDYLMLAHHNADKVKKGLQEVLAWPVN